jgi:hypothetical protein
LGFYNRAKLHRRAIVFPSTITRLRNRGHIRVASLGRNSIVGENQANLTCIRVRHAFSQEVLRMKGSARVLEELNSALCEELTAINQYFFAREDV